MSSYFPTQVTDVFTQGRDFATAVLPITGYSPISVITTIQRSLKYVIVTGYSTFFSTLILDAILFFSYHFLTRLLVATQNGFLYVYDVSEVEGGDCKLIVKHNLRNVETQPIKIQGNCRNFSQSPN